MSIESEIAGLTAAINSLAAVLANNAKPQITITPPEAAALPPPAAPVEEQPKPKAEKKAKKEEVKTETVTPEVLPPQEISKEEVVAAGQKVLDHYSAKNEDGVPKIKAVNEKFGFRPSTCPPEKRAEFIAALEALLK